MGSNPIFKVGDLVSDKFAPDMGPGIVLEVKKDGWTVLVLWLKKDKILNVSRQQLYSYF